MVLAGKGELICILL